MTTPQILTTADQFREAIAAATVDTASEAPVVGLVPTMGALHSGHAALLEAARQTADVVVASVFINPLQFDDDADYQHYPRQLEEDAEFLAEHGVQLIFAPDVEEMYPGFPDGPQILVSTGDMGRMWEGASREGHFDGVATVVTKLFSIATPPAPARLEAWFGQKDAEQLAIIQRMVTDLSLPVTIRAVSIVRDDNGLALSSRNQRLTEEEYRTALQLNQALFTLAERSSGGWPLEVESLVAELNMTEGLDLDYLVVVDPATLREVDMDSSVDQDGSVRESAGLNGEALALIAAYVGPVRLIDNLPLTFCRRK